MEIPDLTQSIVAEHFHLHLPSKPEWIGPTVEYLKQRAVICGACSETRCGKLLIALHEAISNAIIHGNLEVSSELREREDNLFMETVARRAADPAYGQRMVDILVDYDGERCRWTVADQGPGFDVEAVMARLEGDEPDALASGRGILMMCSLMDGMRYERGGRTVVLTLNQESGAERRQRRRLAVHTQLHVVPVHPDGTVDWEAAYDAVAKNLSQDGVSVLQSRLSKTDRIVIGVFSGDQPVYIPAEVRHWRSVGGDVVELGCRFTPEGRPARHAPGPPAGVAAAIDGLLARAQARADADRRAHPRVLYADPVRVFPAGGGGPAVGYPRDLSKGGISLLTTRPLEGEVVVEFSRAETGSALRVRTEILRCVKLQEGFFHVAGRFVAMEGAAEGQE